MLICIRICILIGPYVVMKLSVENVNLLGLLWATRGMTFAHNFATLLISVDALGQAQTAMPNIINNMLKQVRRFE